jgi:hypothetical protein
MALTAIGMIPKAAAATTPATMVSASGALDVCGRATDASRTRNSVLRFKAAI